MKSLKTKPSRTLADVKAAYPPEVRRLAHGALAAPQDPAEMRGVRGHARSLSELRVRPRLPRHGELANSKKGVKPSVLGSVRCRGHSRRSPGAIRYAFIAQEEPVGELSVS